MTLPPLKTLRIAYNNLSGKPWSTAALVAVVAITAFALFGGSILSKSLNNGINSLEARLGADIAVVPPGSETDYENIIITGMPAKFYLDRSIEAQIAGIPGVEQVTSQFYLTSLDSQCCSEKVQIIGIDYNTDFVTKPWISQIYDRQFGDDELIVGNSIAIDRDGTIMFVNRRYKIAAQLGKTGTGMDTVVFANMNTVQELADSIQAIDGEYLEDVDIDNSVSAVLIRVDSGFEPAQVVSNIRDNLPGIGTVTSSGLYSTIGKSLGFFTGVIRTISIILGILSVLILAVLFSLITNSRKKEFAILRILGAARKKLTGIVLAEALIISLCGTILGSFLAALAVFPFGSYIGFSMGLPFLLPDLTETLKLIILGLVFSVIVGPLFAAYSAFKISRAETYATMREGE